ncbi:C-type lectin domain family 4 member F-like [Daphnia carinata]|uniref:C-type lectin domain family 4 member F-like n=1 Tax=Daphnia carinata TaxID=120202 RepID=UPI00257BB973|nr:C-type lectin domain family 4 member F-like [Daphnia carinata]
MGSELRRWTSVALFIFSLLSCTTSATEKEKLLVWIQEHSDMFVMLKHWNDLPLISTAWKRLKTTSQVQEDRKNFIKNVESFLELFGDDLKIKADSNSSQNVQIPKLNATMEVALSRENSTSGSELKDNAMTSVDGDKSVSLKNETDTNRATHFEIEAFKCENVTTITVNKNVSLNSCTCNDSQQFDQRSFLRDYEDEKRWLRSQLIPLNYLFEKLKTVEDSFTNLQRVDCTNAIKKDETNSNTTSSADTGAGNPDVHQVLLRLENLEKLSKTFSKEYENLTAAIALMQETAKATSENFELLSSRVSELAVSKTALAERNNTEDVEYCPEHLDERVPCAEVGNSCYCFSKLQKNWTSAQEFCRKNDMYLLSLETQNETDFINNYIKNSGLPKDFYWTSGSDEAIEGQWVWTSTLENVTVTNWRNNQPDGGKKENWVSLPGENFPMTFRRD